MLNGKLVSCQEVIRRVLRDTPTSEPIPYSDAQEWAVDTLDLINTPRAYRPEVQTIVIEDYKGKLPCNYKQMTQATGANKFGGVFPMTYSQNTFHPTINGVDPATTIGGQNTTWNGLVVDLNAPVGVDTAGNPVFNYITSSTLTSLPLEMVEMLKKNIPSNPTYTLNDDYIFTSFKEGHALLSYLAYPFDCDGYPMIPDDIYFAEACAKYCTYMLDYQDWRKGQLPDKVFQKSESDYLWYVGAARGAANMPNTQQLERLKNITTRLIPKQHSYNSFFKNISQPENRKRF